MSQNPEGLGSIPRLGSRRSGLISLGVMIDRQSDICRFSPNYFMFLGRRNVLEPQSGIWGETKFQKTCNSMMSDIICKKVAFYVVCESQGGH